MHDLLKYLGAAQGIFVTEDDYVLEGPNMNLGILTYENEFIVSPLYPRCG